MWLITVNSWFNNQAGQNSLTCTSLAENQLCHTLICSDLDFMAPLELMLCSVFLILTPIPASLYCRINLAIEMVVQMLQKDPWQAHKLVWTRMPQVARAQSWRTSVVMEACIRRAWARLEGKTVGVRGTVLIQPSFWEREHWEGTLMRTDTWRQWRTRAPQVLIVKPYETVVATWII